MALLPSGYIYATTGNYNLPTEKVDGGTVVGVTSATNTTTGPITRTFPLTSNAIEGSIDRRVVVVAASGAAHAYSATKAYAAGTFAYDQDQFMIRTVATKINNVASTLLSINGLPKNRPHTLISNKSKGAKTSTAHRSGYWNGVGVANQRTNWSTPPSSNNVSYVLPTNNASNADDQGQFVTYKSVPGELAYMYGAIDPKLKDYPAK
jgi:hypothetical protein